MLHDIVKHVQVAAGFAGQTSNSHHRLSQASSHSVKQSDPLDQLFLGPSSLFQSRSAIVCAVSLAVHATELK